MSTNPGPFNLVACVGEKLDHAAPAKDLYCSPWFRLVRAVVEARRQPWAILSAKHGLVMPDTIIEPYDATLLTRPRAVRELWAHRVFLAVPEYDCYSIWGGEKYCETLARMLRAERPLQYLGIGEQISYLGGLLHEATKAEKLSNVQRLLSGDGCMDARAMGNARHRTQGTGAKKPIGKESSLTSNGKTPKSGELRSRYRQC